MATRQSISWKGKYACSATGTLLNSVPQLSNSHFQLLLRPTRLLCDGILLEKLNPKKTGVMQTRAISALIVSFFSLLLLSACGGGSSNQSLTPASNGGTANPTPTTGSSNPAPGGGTTTPT